MSDSDIRELQKKILEIEHRHHHTDGVQPTFDLNSYLNDMVSLFTEEMIKARHAELDTAESKLYYLGLTENEGWQQYYEERHKYLASLKEPKEKK